MFVQRGHRYSGMETTLPNVPRTLLGCFRREGEEFWEHGWQEVPCHLGRSRQLGFRHQLRMELEGMPAFYSHACLLLFYSSRWWQELTPGQDRFRTNSHCHIVAV